jgi:hypothetical protein
MAASCETMKRPFDARGFDTIHVSHPGNFAGSIANFILALQIKNLRLFDRIQRFPVLNWRLTANLFDIHFADALGSPIVYTSSAGAVERFRWP